MYVVKNVSKILFIVFCFFILSVGNVFAATSFGSNIITDTTVSDCTDISKWTVTSQTLGGSSVVGAWKSDMSILRSTYDTEWGGDEVLRLLYRDKHVEGSASYEIGLEGITAQVNVGAVVATASVYAYRDNAEYAMFPYAYANAQMEMQFYNGSTHTYSSAGTITHTSGGNTWQKISIDNVQVPSGTTAIKIILSETFLANSIS